MSRRRLGHGNTLVPSPWQATHSGGLALSPVLTGQVRARLEPLISAQAERPGRSVSSPELGGLWHPPGDSATLP
jgi:hypothetical protein